MLPATVAEAIFRVETGAKADDLDGDDLYTVSLMYWAVDARRYAALRLEADKETQTKLDLLLFPNRLQELAEE